MSNQTQKKDANIYRITNTKNGWVYIGSTVKTIQERMRVHWANRGNKVMKTLMYVDMCAQERDDFIIEKICTVCWAERWSTEKAFTVEAKKAGKCYNVIEGKTPSAAMKISISAKMKGRKLTDQHRVNVSRARGGKQIRCIETGKIYDSLCACIREIGASPHLRTNIIKGRPYRGLNYEYIEEPKWYQELCASNGEN